MKNSPFILFFFIHVFIFSQNKIKHDVYFDTDSYSVKETEQNRLMIFIDSIKSIDAGKISIFGFCDDRGSNSYNLKLSNQRANTIKRLFIKNEIDSTIITNVDGKGELLLKIINTNNTDLVRGLNRKVEILVTLKPKVEIPELVVVKKKVNETVEVLKKELHVGDKITLKNILFKNGFSTILDESRETLQEIAQILVERENIYFTIQGHVCCTYRTRDAVDAKTKKRNLSLARAQFIYDYLAEKGVKRNRMKFEGLKRKFPLGGDPKLDRRVEIKITHIAEQD
ncbi:OmpA family protein [Flavobacteriaceae bacterium AU392]|nr:OmpA family protein [Flavobacteriaceae bacterium]RKM84813.1 OmpA family protein [Flavobacteriaceae bacterium AU392]